MSSKRPSDSILPAVSHDVAVSLTLARQRAEQREAVVYRGLVRALSDLAHVEGPAHAVKAFTDDIVATSPNTKRTSNAIQTHISEALRLHTASELPGIKADTAAAQRQNAQDHMKYATCDVELRDTYPAHVSAAIAAIKEGSANPRQHLIVGAHMMGRHEEAFAREAMSLVPTHRHDVYEAFAGAESRSGNKAILLHQLGASSKAVRRGPAAHKMQ